MSKRLLISWVFCLVGMGQALASDVLTAGDVTLPQGGEAAIEVGCQFDTQFKAFQFDVELPDGLELVANSSGKPASLLGFSGTDHTVSSSKVAEGVYRFICTSMNNMLLPQGGALLSMTVKATGAPAVGDAFTGRVTNTEFTAANYDVYNLTGTSFTITIGEPADTRLLLDEASTTAPAAATGVDVRVKRSIRGGEWSTLCLPFAMTEAQVKAAFGSDVQLGDFADYAYDAAADAIVVNFVAATAIEANHPYIIKVEEPVGEFTADGVDVDPQEAVVDFDASRRKNQPRQFVGTYVAGTELGWGTLFLSGGRFWYSTGLTTMKGYRAYFNFIDLLAGFEESYASRITLNLLGRPTGIDEVDGSPSASGSCHDLQGRRVAQPAHGLYIRDGKKIFVK